MRSWVRQLVGTPWRGTLLGTPLNDALAYDTSKKVRIHDGRLGCLHYMWMLFVFCWVVIYQIFYANQRYKLFDVKGGARVTIQQPTEACNPNKNDCMDRLKPFTELPYCLQYRGPTNTSAEDDRHNCIFRDQHELVPEGMLEGDMFVPTRIDEMVERRNCVPSEANNWSCKKLWKMESNEQNTYVADIEDYTIMLVSSYYRRGIKGTSTKHQGAYYECRDPKSGQVIGTEKCKKEDLQIRPINCLKGVRCAFLPQEVTGPGKEVQFLERRGRRSSSGATSAATLAAEAESPREERASDTDDAFAIRDGDVFTMGKLLQLAGLDLDRSFLDGEPLRERGTMLLVKIEYNNLRPWTGATQPAYIYRVVERPMDEMKTEMYAARQPDDYPASRIIENRHGIYLKTSVDGVFGFFDPIYFLVMLTTSVALLGAGRVAVDAIAVYLLPYYEATTEQAGAMEGAEEVDDTKLAAAGAGDGKSRS